MLVAVVGPDLPRYASLPRPSTRRRNGRPRTSRVARTRRSTSLRAARREVDFPLMVPTVIERSSWIDREKPVRVYYIDKDAKEHKAVRLTYKIGGTNEYWGVQKTDWEDAPVLNGRNFVRQHRRPSVRALLQRAEAPHGGAPHARRLDYWVVNTLLDRLSNETMLAIAKGLKPVGAVKQ